MSSFKDAENNIFKRKSFYTFDNITLKKTKKNTPQEGVFPTVSTAKLSQEMSDEQ